MSQGLELKLHIVKTSNVAIITIFKNILMVGLNTLRDRFHELNGLIPLEWLNKTIDLFEILCKTKFLIFTQ
jgi:hypothetical protein